MSPTEFASRLLSKPYELIFKEQLEQRTAEFFLSTSYVAVGTLFGSALTFIFLIIGAHILGPQGFGDLSLLLSIGPIVAISMGLNLVATVNYASGAPDDSARTRILSTASIEALLLVTASTTILALLSPQLSYLLGVSAAVFIFAVAYGVAVTCFMLAMNALRVLFSMKAYALSNAAQSVVCLALFLALVTDGMKSWQSAAYALSASNLAVSLIVIFYVRAHLTRQFDWHWARVIMRYSFFAAPGLIAVALMGLDRLLINIFMTTAAVGLYNAYFLSSITVAAGLWGIINATFFPYASRSTDKLALLLKINKVVPYFGVVLVPLIVCAEVIAFVFYGHQYSLSLQLSFFFALAAAVYVVFLSYTWLAASVGARGAKMSAACNVLALLVLIVLDTVLIPRIGILGAAITLIFSYLVPTVFLYSRKQFWARI
ncbi:MAG: oligosaccharide flippase family protein [Halobacteriota archaeon]